MNDTKWNELRLAMYAIEPPPLWSALDLNGYRSPPEREWFFPFRIGGYASILSVDITTDSPAHRERVRSALKTVHVPGEGLSNGFRVFGYLEDGQIASYLCGIPGGLTCRQPRRGTTPRAAAGSRARSGEANP